MGFTSEPVPVFLDETGPRPGVPLELGTWNLELTGWPMSERE